MSKIPTKLLKKSATKSKKSRSRKSRIQPQSSSAKEKLVAPILLIVTILVSYLVMISNR